MSRQPSGAFQEVGGGVRPNPPAYGPDVVKVVFVTRCPMKGMKSNLIVRVTRISVTQALMVNIYKAWERIFVKVDLT